MSGRLVFPPEGAPWRHKDRVRRGAWMTPPRGRVSDDAAWRAMAPEDRTAWIHHAREALHCQGEPDPDADEVEHLARVAAAISRALTTLPLRPYAARRPRK